MDIDLVKIILISAVVCLVILIQAIRDPLPSEERERQERETLEDLERRKKAARGGE